MKVETYQIKTGPILIDVLKLSWGTSSNDIRFAITYFLEKYEVETVNEVLRFKLH